MENNQEEKILDIKLDANGVVAPLNNILKECHETIMFGLNMMEHFNNISIPESLHIDKTFIEHHIDNVETNIDILKEKYKYWLIKKGFEDFINGLNLCLIQSYEYISIIEYYNTELKDSKKTTYGEFKSRIENIRREAQNQDIKGFLKKIRPFLSKQLNYENQILSFYKVRNCLVHRNGIVSEKDINDKKNSLLKLEWIRLKLIAEFNNVKKEIEWIELIKAGTKISYEKARSFINFRINDRISLNYKQLNEIMFTCFLFGDDLRIKLPQVNDKKIVP